MTDYYVLHAGKADAEGSVPQLIVDVSNTEYRGMIMSWVMDKDGEVDPPCVVFPSAKDGWETPFWAHKGRLGVDGVLPTARVLLAIWQASCFFPATHTPYVVVHESSICDLMWEAIAWLLPETKQGARPADVAHVLELVLQAIDACTLRPTNE